MKLEAARLQDAHSCPATEPRDHLGGPVVGPGAERVFIEGQKAALLADHVSCAGAAPGPVLDLIKRGAAKVRAHGLPMARRTDTCTHGGTIDGGATKVFIGGPVFEVPPNFVLDGPIAYQNRIIRDFYLLSTIPAGNEFLTRLANSGKPVRFKCADGQPDSVDGGVNEDGEIVVNYDSTSVRYSYGDDGGVVPEPPQARLAHEMIHALHDAEGTTRPPGETDPSPDETYRDPNTGKEHQPPMEESVTTGTGAGEGQPLTENQVRKELGLPPRDKYLSPSYPAHQGEAKDLRPGSP